jgi:hypothetical protein
MIEEIATDLDVKPDAIFCSVGGGGLLSGVMLGCKMVGWDDGEYNSHLISLPCLVSCCTGRAKFLS